MRIAICLLTLIGFTSGLIYVVFGGSILYAAANVIIDAIDGKLARYFNVTSEYGKRLDFICDVIIAACCAMQLPWGFLGLIVLAPIIPLTLDKHFSGRTILLIGLVLYRHFS